MLLTFCSLYFATLCQFVFVSHPVLHCFLLLQCSFCCGAIAYLSCGYSWYVALFCLVYIGGVYVLFIFVSIHAPNPCSYAGSNLLTLPVFFVLFLFFFFGFEIVDSFGTTESSHLICSSFEGSTYCVLCLTLLIGFSIVSLVSSEKGSFYR